MLLLCAYYDIASFSTACVSAIDLVHHHQYYFGLNIFVELRIEGRTLYMFCFEKNMPEEMY